MTWFWPDFYDDDASDDEWLVAVHQAQVIAQRDPIVYDTLRDDQRPPAENVHPGKARKSQ